MESENSTNVDIFKFMSQKAQSLREERDELDRGCADHALLKMLEEGLHADITLVAQGGSVKAHRCVLVSVSPVFSAMLQHNMKKQLTSTVDIPDMTIDGLQLFLLVLYTTNECDRIQLDDGEPMEELISSAIDNHFAEFFGAVHKYRVENRLKRVLLHALDRNLTPDNCWDYFNGSSQVVSSSPAVHYRCRRYILNNCDDVVQSKSFLKEMRCNPKQVHTILKMAIKRQKW